VESVRGIVKRRGAAGRGVWTGLLSPGAVVLLLLFLVPLGMLIVFSFGSVNIVGRPVLGFSLANYDLVFQSYNLAVVFRTILYAGSATAICLVLGYGLAYTASRFAGRMGGAIIALVVVPWLVDYLVRIYAWQQLLGDGGLVNQVLGWVHIGPLTLIGTGPAVVGGLVYGYLPLMILPIYAALSDMDPSLIDAGKDLYGTPRATFLHVTLPATRQGVIGGCLLVFLPSLGDFATAQFLGGPNTTMIGNIISEQFVGTGSQAFGAALAVTLIALLAVTVALVALILRRRARLTQIVRVG
jgi:spermidine/putrescine transport system permease protein